MNKNLLGGIALAKWLLMGCSNNNTINENDEVEKDSVAIIKDSVNRTLIEVVDQNIYNCIQRKRVAKYDKITLPETEVEGVKENKNTAKSRVEDLIRMYEDWIDDGDEMKEYMTGYRENPDYHNIGVFFSHNAERKGSYEVDKYDTDKELEDHIRFTENTK